MIKPSYTDLIKREGIRIYRQKSLLLFMMLGPLVLSALLIATFWNGVMVSIPIGILDEDGTAYSREFIGFAEASPSLSVVKFLESAGEGLALIQEGSINGMLILPKDFEKDIKRGTQATIAGRYNNQYLTQGGTLNSAFTQIASTYAAKYDATRYIARGIPQEVALGYVLPVNVNSHLLFNPSLDYSWFLLLGVLPVIWQLLAMGTMVYMMGKELSEQSPEISSYMKNHSVQIVLAKTTPYFILLCVHYCIILFMLFGIIGIPFRGSFLILMGASLLFVSCTVSIGTLIISAIKKISVAMSVTSIYLTPAFAYAGVTFPYEAMPLIARIWSNLLPITHYHRILVDTAVRGAPTWASLHSLLILSLFTVLTLPAAIEIFRYRMAADEK